MGLGRTAGAMPAIGAMPLVTAGIGARLMNTRGRIAAMAITL